MKYRKKPVVIEAYQMTKERRHKRDEWPQWLQDAWNGGPVKVADDATDRLTIATLEGNHLVSWGDFIIQGVRGELYPCKPDIFMETYEPVE